MADSLGISEAQLLGVFLASVFWGMLVITFVQAIRYLIWDSDAKGAGLKPASGINWAMLSVALILMALSTLDVSLGLMHSIEAFIFFTGPGGSAARFTGLTDWVNIVKTCNIVFGKLISDGVLVYRCWVVCNKSIFVVIFPIMLWLGYLALAIFVIYLEASAGNPKILLTGANNIITTANHQYGLQSATGGSGSRSFFGRRRSTLQQVTRIIIESGMLYTTMALITFITFEVGSNSFYPTSDAELQILSIAFNLIIIRISTRSNGYDNYNTQSAQSGPQTVPLRKLSSAMRSPNTMGSTQVSSLPYSGTNKAMAQDSFIDVEEGNWDQRAKPRDF
ncbi:hypothetical protein GYMLUDRAFT_574980 [Collybiopsis luxurians FD-317 M1]|uniref:Uncharacterized protein n=1 Tax=Collybiopsis luxurians FD-317 M1 TaxID=944289 RepID=A0A0D0CRB8_9AGAR|nr:hypothetical protein GYMLUDRAFT_574980 [Collybiopsis luxurians FD-317 M1]